MGRTSLYTPELADAICDRIATSSDGLRKICNETEEFPDFATVFRWLAKPEYKDFRDKYARARETQADLLADEIIEIADDSKNDTQTDHDGVPIVNHDNINRSRLRVDARKWKASKLAPKKYGERLEVENSGEMKFVITTRKKDRPTTVDDGN